MFAKFLVPIFSALAINECTVKDTFAFAKETNKTDCEYFKASSDVKVLFINISLEENCVNYLFFDKSKIDNLTNQELDNLSSAAVTELLIIFESNLYRLIDGLAIEFPLCSTLANAFFLSLWKRMAR